MTPSARLYTWGFALLICSALWLAGCSILPRQASLLLPPPDVESEVPAGTGPQEEVAFFRKKAAQYHAAADVAEAALTKAKTASRQAWLWWSGVACIVLGAVAFALAFAYPVASFLRVGGWASAGGGVAMLLVGEALPYFGLLALVAVAAIALALVLHSKALREALVGWRGAAVYVPKPLRDALDDASRRRQPKLVRTFLTKCLGK